MGILGVETAIYGVSDVAESRRFFEDYGLRLDRAERESAVFELADGSRVELRHEDDPTLPARWFQGAGIRETIWGVDTDAALERLVADLTVDREVRRDNDGTAHFVADDGMPQGLRLFRRREVVSVNDPVNTPSRLNRVNQHRTWRRRARPKYIAHVVFQVPDPWASMSFFRDRLGFRLSDSQRSLGCYARADGSHEHHNIFFLNQTYLPPPLAKPGFNHTAFMCDDIDEIMVGSNFLERRGWAMRRGGFSGLGRHRISSALFYYVPCPAGGHAEYIADADYLDDSWLPRDWDEAFGSNVWIHDIPEFLRKEPNWDVKYVAEPGK
jgi:catechol 2,3-dioxygenase-like lactoylglutathione lyase family enzyme